MNGAGALMGALPQTRTVQALSAIMGIAGSNELATHAQSVMGAAPGDRHYRVDKQGLQWNLWVNVSLSPSEQVSSEFIRSDFRAVLFAWNVEN